jgi:acetyltransferase-like isoleucine patch superfamily enzyme
MKKLKYVPLDSISFLFSLFMFKKAGKALKYVVDKTNTFYLARYFQRIGMNSFWEYPTFIYGQKYMTIGDNFYSFPRLRLEAFDELLGIHHSPKVTIGSNVSINYDCHIACCNRIDIGNHVVAASRVFITDHYHGEISKKALDTPPDLRFLFSKGPVKIEDNVLIGEGVAIMPNVHIGKNVIIGANAVVTSDIKANTVIGGIPAKIIRDFN